METTCSDSLKGLSSCSPQKERKNNNSFLIPFFQRLGPSVCISHLAASLNYSLGEGVSVFKAGSIPLKNRAFLIKALCPQARLLQRSSPITSARPGPSDTRLIRLFGVQMDNKNTPDHSH